MNSNWLASSSKETSNNQTLEGKLKRVQKSGWKKTCDASQKKTNLKLVQYNWLIYIYMTYTTPVKVNKYNINLPDLCFKCNEAKGRCMPCVPCVWECDKIQTFWREVINNLVCEHSTCKNKLMKI